MRIRSASCGGWVGEEPPGDGGEPPCVRLSPREGQVHMTFYSGTAMEVKKEGSKEGLLPPGTSDQMIPQGLPETQAGFSRR